MATIAIFEQFKIDNALFNLIFGESILNDATVIVLFRTVNRFAEKDLDFDAETFFYAIFEFLYISVGSISIGIAFGFAFSLITKHLKLHGDLPTLSLIMFAYLSYVIAEGTGRPTSCLVFEREISNDLATGLSLESGLSDLDLIIENFV